MSMPTLARGPIARVEREPDGHVVLHVGPVAVRLTASAMTSLSSTLSEAVQVLELEPATLPLRRCQRAFTSQS